MECICADARDETGYAQALGGRRADLLLTDPPYCLLTRRRKGGDLRDARAHKKIDRDPVVRFENVREYRAFTAAWLPLALRALRPGAFAILWTNFLGKQPILEVAAEHGFRPVHPEFIWAKRTQAAPGAEGLQSNEELLRIYEVALILGTAAPTPLTDADRSPVHAVVTGYDDDAEHGRWGDHPHHKPFNALEPLVRNYSVPGEWVLDPFAGSGTTE